MRSRFLLAGFAAMLACVSPGCATTGATKTLGDNPIIVPSDDFEAVWNATVVVVDQYFDISTEDRIQRKIVTQPKSGATLLEPWDGDSVDFAERFECTLQTIRRFAIVTVEPAPTGQGWAVRVEVRKELEDLAQPDRQSIGRAVFNNVSRSAGPGRSSARSRRRRTGSPEAGTPSSSRSSWPRSRCRCSSDPDDPSSCTIRKGATWPWARSRPRTRGRCPFHREGSR